MPRSPNPLNGKPLRYLIGADRVGMGKPDAITEVGYDIDKQLSYGITAAYCNLFNEKYDEQSEDERKQFGPYLHKSDVAKAYNEGQIDPNGIGWDHNLRTQLARRKASRFPYIELDNADAYEIDVVLAAVQMAWKEYGLRVFAKNPGNFSDEDALAYIKHPGVYGVIVEKDCGTPGKMQELRKAADKLDMPVWFVFFDHHGNYEGRYAAFETSQQVKYINMSVSYSAIGEYVSSTDVFT